MRNIKNTSFNARDIQNLKRLASDNNNKLALNKNNEKIESKNDYILYITNTHFRIQLLSKNFTFYQNAIFSNINIIYNRYILK